MRRAAETLEAKQATHREIAKTYAFAGNDERALDWLERGFEARDPNMPYIATGPTWDSLRDDFRSQQRRAQPRQKHKPVDGQSATVHYSSSRRPRTTHRLKSRSESPEKGHPPTRSSQNLEHFQ